MKSKIELLIKGLENPVSHDNAVKCLDAMSDEAYKAYLQSKGTEQIQYARSFLHSHTDLGSPKDAILTAKDYVRIAKDMGAGAIAITDHGTMYAVPTLYDLCKSAGIKLIVGVEFYVCDTVEDTSRKRHTRLHLIAYAKDNIGYRAICRLVTASGKRELFAGNGKLAYPCISKTLLQQYIGEGSEGHGHVILTSACCGGVLIGIAKADEDNGTNIQVINNNLESAKQALSILSTISEKEKNLEDIEEQMVLISKKTYSKRENALKKTPDEEAEKQLEKEKQETSLALNELPKLRAQIKTLKVNVKRYQELADKLTKVKYCPVSELQAYIERQEKEKAIFSSETLSSSDAIIKKMEEEALWYDNIAGHGNWYIEIQYHGISVEQQYMHVIADIAKAHDIPLEAANDAHMCTSEDCEARKFINALRFNEWENPDDGEREIYLKNDAMLYKWLVKAVGSNIAFEAMLGRKAIVDACNVSLEREEHYPKYVV